MCDYCIHYKCDRQSNLCQCELDMDWELDGEDCPLRETKQDVAAEKAERIG